MQFLKMKQKKLKIIVKYIEKIFKNNIVWSKIAWQNGKTLSFKVTNEKVKIRMPICYNCSKNTTL